jgi:hypothetical protein
MRLPGADHRTCPPVQNSSSEGNTTPIAQQIRRGSRTERGSYPVARACSRCHRGPRLPDLLGGKVHRAGPSWKPIAKVAPVAHDEGDVDGEVVAATAADQRKR